MGIALRLLYLATPTLDSDQAIFGLMARHILHGERPWFQWGVHYMGALECYVAAAYMALLGPTRFALKLAPASFSLLFAYAAYAFGVAAGDRRVGLWAAALACLGVPYFIETSLRAEVYIEVLALGTIALVLALRAVTQQHGPRLARELALLGLVLGLAFWEQVNAVFYGSAIVLFWLVERPSLLRAAALWALPSFVLGSAPFWYEVATNGFALASNPKPVLFAERLTETLQTRLPMILASSGPLAKWLIAAHVASLGILLTIALRPNGAKPRAARLLVAYGAIAFLGYVASPFSGVKTLRYLIPLYTVFMIAPALALGELASGGSVVRRGSAVAIGLAMLASQAGPAIARAPVLDRVQLAHYLDGAESDRRLLSHLESLGLHEIYVADYWQSARWMFDAGERFTFATPFIDRRSEYLDAVDGSPRPAFLFDDDEQARAFESTLRLGGARYSKVALEGNLLYWNVLAAAGRGAEIPIVAATASTNSTDAMLASDRDAATRWESLAPQRRGMWFQVDLGAPRDVSEISLWPRSRNEMPRGLRVEVSLDGVGWNTVDQAHALWNPLSWGQGRPLPALDGWVVARFAETRCRWIRLVTLGGDEDDWGIAEIIVRGPPLDAPALSEIPPRGNGALFADPVIAARIPGAVRHWQGHVLPRHESLRDVSMVGPDDEILVPASDPLARDGADPRIGAVARSRRSFGGYALLGGIHLETDRWTRLSPTAWSEDRHSGSAWLDAGRVVAVAGVIVEHREAASSYPRGLVAEASSNGVDWGEPVPLQPRPDGLLWAGEQLMGTSLTRRIFLFPSPVNARFLRLAASPRHDHFPWVVRKATLLLPPP